MELSKFTANCTKSAQFTDPCPELCEICALHANFSRFCIPSGKIARIRAIRIILIFAEFAQYTLLEITQAAVNTVKSALSLLICNNFSILTLVRQDPAPCLSESREFRNLKLQFTKYQFWMKFPLLCTH